MTNWRDIAGYEGKYEVSDLGDVRNAKSGSVLKQRAHHKSGHPIVNLCSGGVKKTYQVSRLVAEAFIENKTTLNSVKHKNGDISDNRASNLEWAGIPIDVLREEYEVKGLTTYEIAEKHGYKDHKPVLRQLKAAGIKRRSWMVAVDENGKLRTADAIASFRSEFPEADESIASDRWGRHNYRKAHRRRDTGIDWRSVGERDGWICGICGKKVDKRQSFGPYAPSVDHIVPIADGGTDTWDNVQLAHVRCNSAKGRKTLADAMKAVRCV